ncbi:hypothetical protein BZA05DRAFT_470618 [Tricharina praecox]|uniref:uncharacterized protein n=1 Tax=Tricharina praecox TaxID=43433 RepID=UPI00221F6549|nr:uncharacterized protein BZA05DRAFT_470618 [Tricharina praecox]KAI5857754.1 hypothetical protein BZA05DRAFT_470618 [Tricharina praecox]
MSKPEFELIYWPSMPGRGEPIRLLFEATGTSYTDTTDEAVVVSYITPSPTSPTSSLPSLAPPILLHANRTLSQTAAILFYLSPLLGLSPAGFGEHQMRALILTALDLQDEAHNTHHPVGVSLFYADQLAEAARAAEIFRRERVGKFFKYFEGVLGAAEGEGKGKGGWLLGGGLSAADLVLWQVVDGLKYAFPKATARVLAECPRLERHYGLVKAVEGVKSYLESGRRRKYDMGVYRYYPELDDQEGDE